MKRSRHQRIRTAVLTVSTLLLFPFKILFLLSPLWVFLFPFLNPVVVNYALRGFMIYFALAGFSACLAGRAYCSHICPITGIFSFISFLKKDRTILSFEYPAVLGKVFFILWLLAPGVVWGAVICSLVVKIPIPAIFQVPEVLVFYSFMMVSALLSKTLGKVENPHGVCSFSPWITTIRRLGTRLNTLKYDFDQNPDKCKQCGLCQPKCVMNKNIAEILEKGSLDFSECLNCGACAEKCPTGAIQYKGRKT